MSDDSRARRPPEEGWWQAPLIRGLYQRSLAGILVTIVGRSADPDVAQAALTSGAGVAGLGPVPSLLPGIYTIASIRHIYWITLRRLLPVVFGPTGGAIVAVNNSLLNTLMAAANAASSNSIAGWAASLGWQQWAGLGLFLSGIAIEMLSEDSRRKFKSDPRNKTKVDGTGLSGVVCRPNYLGYTLWCTGASLATGSITPGDMDEKRVPYKIIPGLY
ncbi:hypothetical protein GGF50DRAFT_130263 [Schizophyllum commune]